MRLYLAVIVFSLGMWQVSEGLWIHLKARLAQVLIESAWDASLMDKKIHKPWPWADTWPVARMTINNEVLFILEGAQGNSLAFGPGHLQGSVLPGQTGVSIIGGHRDTHFRFLEHINKGQAISIDHKTGSSNYRVSKVAIRDSDSDPLSFQGEEDQIVLITCYPFNNFEAGGSLRYVVTAERDEPGSDLITGQFDKAVANENLLARRTRLTF